jgi:putative acetyltransferase
MQRIVPGDLTDPRVVALVKHHLSTARANTAVGSAHALDISGLQVPNITFWVMWDDDTLLGCGALKQITADHGEVKTMHTVKDARRQGIGSAILRHIIIIAAARERGMTRLSLETGSWDFFRPAQALYRRHGFVDCRPFEGYQDDPNSVFLTLELR